jgi:hypothetical protein
MLYRSLSPQITLLYYNRARGGVVHIFLIKLDNNHILNQLLIRPYWNSTVLMDVSQFSTMLKHILPIDTE